MGNGNVIQQLQSIVQNLQAAKSTEDTVYNEVVINPGPLENPTAQSLLQQINSLSSMINAECQELIQLSQSGSSIAVKNEVAYVDEAARAKLAEQTMGIRLARFKYKHVEGGREHLGFILEDSPNVAAADMEGKRVDLYAYTSMVVATVQQQQTEIKALRAELERLAQHRH